MSDVPLLCAQEIDVYGAAAPGDPRDDALLRAAERKPEHVYLRDATQLRPDLAGAQVTGLEFAHARRCATSRSTRRPAPTSSTAS